MGNWRELSSVISHDELFQDKPKPTDFTLFDLDINVLEKQIINKSPDEILRFKLPTSKEGFEVFELKSSEVVHPDLQKKYPALRSYQGKSEESSKRVRLSFTPQGLNAMIIDEGRNIQFIEPSSQNQSKYISYKRDDLKNIANDFLCKTENLSSFQEKGVLAKNFNDLKMRTFRLALACTGEYAQFHIARAGIQNATDAQKKNIDFGRNGHCD